MATLAVIFLRAEPILNRQLYLKQKKISRFNIIVEYMPNLSKAEEVYKQTDNGGWIQSIIVPLSIERSRIEGWLKKNGFQYKKHDRTAKTRRFRQFNPLYGNVTYRTHHLESPEIGGVQIVVMHWGDCK
jgi:hypothetical protein